MFRRIAYIDTGNYAGAVTILNEALYRMPDYEEARQNLSVAKSRLEEVEERTNPFHSQ